MSLQAPSVPTAVAGAEIDALLAKGDSTAALAAARKLWSAGADAAAGRFLRQRGAALWAPLDLRPHRLAILRSFTVEPVIPLLEAEAALAGCRLECWVGAFNAYAQEIHDPASGLYAHRPDTVILALQTRDIAPRLWAGFGELSPEALAEEIDSAAALLIGLLQTLRGATRGHVLCHGLERPPWPSEGLLELNREVRQADALEAVNRKVRAWCAGQAGVHLLDYDGLIGRHGRERWFDEKKFASTRLPLTARATGWLAAEWWRHLAGLALPPAKVLALDLDNTLWGGTLGEAGPEGVQLGTEPPGCFYRDLQQAVLDIVRRGVLVVLVSKNNEIDALEVVDSHPDMLIRRRHLAGWRIDWEPKPGSLIALAAELGLGLESFIFVDDNPAERDFVRRALPEVEVVDLPADPALYAQALRQIPRLERLTSSAEDSVRTEYYADQRARRVAQAAATSLEAFLETLEIEVAIGPIEVRDLPRAAQLTQKTNQLNTTTRRYTEAELAHRLEDPAWRGFGIRARDRFGDNGLVGLALTRDAGEVCEIDTLLLSCRVIGRGIETAFLARLAAEARSRGVQCLEGAFRPTARNAPAAPIYEQAGFQLVSEDADGRLWRLVLSDGGPSVPSWIRGADA